MNGSCSLQNGGLEYGIPPVLRGARSVEIPLFHGMLLDHKMTRPLGPSCAVSCSQRLLGFRTLCGNPFFRHQAHPCRMTRACFAAGSVSGLSSACAHSFAAETLSTPALTAEAFLMKALVSFQTAANPVLTEPWQLAHRSMYSCCLAPKLFGIYMNAEVRTAKHCNTLQL